MHVDRIRAADAAVDAFARGDETLVALWLRCNLTPHHWHIGVAWRDAGRTRRIDQREEGLRVAEEIDTARRWWVMLPVTAATRARLRNALRRLERLGAGDATTRLPYDHIYLGGTFDTDGRYRAAPGERGLNCASVILAAFESVAFPLLDRATFAERRLDEEVLAVLLQDLPNAMDAERLRRHQGDVFLPTEVGGACLFDLPSVPRAQVEAGARHFVALESAGSSTG
jgi:hypothetical protein